MNRLLLAIDQFDSGQVALVFAAEVAHAVGAEVTVLHVRERAVHPRVPSLENPTDAQRWSTRRSSVCVRQASAETHGCDPRAQTMSRGGSSTNPTSRDATRSSSDHVACEVSSGPPDEV